MISMPRWRNRPPRPLTSSRPGNGSAPCHMIPDQHKATLQLERYPRSLDVKGSAKIAHKVAEDRVIPTVDPEARHTRKSSEARRDGYRAHVAADPETGIITNEKLTGACGEQNTDPAVAEEFVAAQAAGHGVDGGLAWYGDSAYGTGELRDAIGRAGHQAVISPSRSSPPWRAALALMTSPSMPPGR